MSISFLQFALANYILVLRFYFWNYSLGVVFKTHAVHLKQICKYLLGANHLQGTVHSILLKEFLEAITLLNVLTGGKYFSMDGGFYLGKWSKVIQSQF